jgi:hypothetical protein
MLPSKRLRPIGFALMCSGVLIPVVMMYELKMVAVDNVAPGGWLFVVPVLLLIVMAIGKRLTSHANGLVKLGR